jgi:hypothetical protein
MELRERLACLALVLSGAAPALADSVTLAPARDNTLYESPTGGLSNGSGHHVIAGRTADGAIRRALLAFDVAASVPAGATITSASLALNLSNTSSGSQTVHLHRALAAWGEGGSDAPGGEGQGAASAPGDATWIHTFFPGSFWSAPGGDFSPAASASQAIDQLGPYVFSAPGMVADAQSWLDDPGANHGWLLKTDEGVVQATKRFDSSEHPSVQLRPALTLEFTPAAVPASSAASEIVLLVALLAGLALAVRRLTLR